MNISLNPNKATKKAKLVYGLNARTPSNAFGDDSSSEEEESGDNHRQRVNQQIAKEQAALRQRAQAALQQTDDQNIYDYDGAYDSFHPQEDSKQQVKQEEPKKSRYIGDLLQVAQKRQREREIIHERKIAKEQALEDQSADYVGKEKFITKAYRRKLEERQQFLAEEEAQQVKDQANDVTKQGLGMAGFYGNLTKNVAMGGGQRDESESAKETDQKKSNPLDDDDDDDFLPKPGGGGGSDFLSGFAKSSDPAESEPQDIDVSVPAEDPKQDKQDGSDVKDTLLTARERRNQKVAAA
eukprot:CAMPEP_0176016476 /NCGR_PEP_ID=MMETSP0120_2-20121206/7870_1 /TAXON_ID=160619 /ORGANISM="Kryptoperidinium foliaceum, Strain CCMP 1326" /LENGTH=295 /DNA_ID=CAMNT_0017349473 /DNA_START=68 /DNA_END=951 /DNA_ORIENTATION=+